MARQLLPVNAPITFLLLLFLLAPAALLQGNNILFWMLAVLVIAIAVSAIGSRFMIRGLQVRRQLPRHGVVGEPLVVRYAVTRLRRRLPAFGLFIDEVGSVAGNHPLAIERSRGWILHVGPGETVHGQAVLVPATRGRVEFDAFVVRTTFPFGMIRRERRFKQLQHILVYPHVYTMRPHVLREIVPQGQDGLRTVDQRGQGEDYFGIRQLRTGDSVRDIAWKLSAHRGELLGIDRSSPSPPRIRIVLDLSTATDALQVGSGEAVPARALEEHAISLVASLVKFITANELEVALTVLGFNEPSLGFRGGTWHVHRIMTLLAGLDLDAARHPAPSRAVSELEHAGLIVVRPDRVRHLGGREDAWYLTARQLNELVEEEPGSVAQGHGESGEEAA